MLSAGFDAVVNERANRMTRPRGPSRYTLALLRELATFRPRTYTIVDRRRRVASSGRCSSRSANNASLGGGMRIVPHADLDDGLLDVFIVHPLSRHRRSCGSSRGCSRASTPTIRRVEFARARRVRIEADDIVAYADGERIGPLPIDVEVVPGALSVFA